MGQDVETFLQAYVKHRTNAVESVYKHQKFPLQCKEMS